jgi:hypothetical protein
MDDHPAPSQLDRSSGQDERKCEIDNINSKKTTGGTARGYLLQRLVRAGRTDLLQGIAECKISVFAAAVAAGIVRRRKTVAGDDCNQARMREHEMAQVLARSSQPPAFNSELPCFHCREACAWKALAEISDAYARGRRGEIIRSASGVLPAVCCRRTMMRPTSVEALIG